jgi:hypothetical protein
VVTYAVHERVGAARIDVPGGGSSGMAMLASTASQLLTAARRRGGQRRLATCFRPRARCVRADRLMFGSSLRRRRRGLFKRLRGSPEGSWRQRAR